MQNNALGSTHVVYNFAITDSFKSLFAVSEVDINS